MAPARKITGVWGQSPHLIKAPLRLFPCFFPINELLFWRSGNGHPIKADGLGTQSLRMAGVVEATVKAKSNRDHPLIVPVRRRAYPCRSIINDSRIASG